MKSALLGRDMKYTIYLPPDYEISSADARLCIFFTATRTMKPPRQPDHGRNRIFLEFI
jgi:hypothetical protein